MLAKHIATVFGVGFLPKAPGTWGSLAAAIVGYGLLLLDDLTVMRGAVLASIIIGLWASNRYEEQVGTHDNKEIVIDEVAGMWITLLPFSAISFGYGLWLDVTLAFIAFRIFDIFKPWPIGWVDRHIDGGLGVMLDDIAAGIMAAAVLIIIQLSIFGS